MHYYAGLKILRACKNLLNLSRERPQSNRWNKASSSDVPRIIVDRDGE